MWSSMDSKDLIKSGKLSEARRQLVEEVKSSPADMGTRTLLVQVLAFCGEWDRAESHLDIIGMQDPKMEIGVQAYRDLIHAERERMEVYALNSRPSFLPETPPYFETYYAGWKKLMAKETEEAQKLFDQVHAQGPVIIGTINGKEFAGFRDTDTFLSFFIEAIVHARYVWIPFESIRELSISPPKSLLDLLWITTNITTWEGLSISCYLPVLYPNSFLHEDDRLKLGRMTDWVPLGGSFSQGIGQHVFEVGEEEIPLLEIREAVFNIPDSEKDGEKSD